MDEGPPQLRRLLQSTLVEVQHDHTIGMHDRILQLGHAKSNELRLWNVDACAEVGGHTQRTTSIVVLDHPQRCVVELKGAFIAVIGGIMIVLTL